MPEIEFQLDNLSKSYGALDVFQGVSMEVRSGEFVSILGPSGAGKSTIFEVLTGNTEPTAGTMRGAGGPVVRSRFAYMPQRDVLFPWRRIIDNAGIGLEVAGFSRKQAREKVSKLLGIFGLEGFGNVYPAQLSGGMRQRVALLRTVIQDRAVLLLDEPFGALDALTRTNMQQWLQDMRQQLGLTIVLITHDVREAVFLSDRICVLSSRPGTIIGELTVDIPSPRTVQSLTTPAAIKIERELYDLLFAQRAD